jgi:hypothetical protein
MPPWVSRFIRRVAERLPRFSKFVQRTSSRFLTPQKPRPVQKPKPPVLAPRLEPPRSLIEQWLKSTRTDKASEDDAKDDTPPSE